MVTDIEKATLSVKECAELLGISENACYEYLIQGKLPAQRLGRRWIISRERLGQWLREAPAIPIGRR